MGVRGAKNVLSGMYFEGGRLFGACQFTKLLESLTEPALFTVSNWVTCLIASRCSSAPGTSQPALPPPSLLFILGLSPPLGRRCQSWEKLLLWDHEWPRRMMGYAYHLLELLNTPGRGWSARSLTQATHGTWCSWCDFRTCSEMLSQLQLWIGW